MLKALGVAAFVLAIGVLTGIGPMDAGDWPVGIAYFALFLLLGSLSLALDVHFTEARRKWDQ